MKTFQVRYRIPQLPQYLQYWNFDTETEKEARKLMMEAEPFCKIFSIKERTDGFTVRGMKCENCEDNEGTEELHPCPFGEEVYGVHKDNCNCCETCTERCYNDV